jgi:hypothetical protein
MLPNVYATKSLMFFCSFFAFVLFRFLASSHAARCAGHRATRRLVNTAESNHHPGRARALTFFSPEICLVVAPMGHRCVCVYVCVCVGLCLLCAFVCLCACVRVFVCLCREGGATGHSPTRNQCAHVHTLTHAHTHAQSHTHIHTHTHTYTHRKSGRLGRHAGESSAQTAPLPARKVTWASASRYVCVSSSLCENSYPMGI